MAINVKGLINRVRSEITMDTDESDPRWSDTVMLDFTIQSCYELFRVKKHLLINEEGAPTDSDSFFAGWDVEGVKNGTVVLQLPAKYEESLMAGVAMRCFLMDSADQNNAARASYERSRFYELAGVNLATGTTTAS